MQTATVQIGAKQWSVDVAATASELQQGLSNLPSLLPNTGMLFDLGVSRIVTVNAYQMMFPLSIVFIGEDLKVTEVAGLLSPGDEGTTMSPCRYFLEVNLGEAAGVSIGDQATITGYTPAGTIDINSIINMMMIMMIMKMMTSSMSSAK